VVQRRPCGCPWLQSSGWLQADPLGGSPCDSRKHHAPFLQGLCNRGGGGGVASAQAHAQSWVFGSNLGGEVEAGIQGLPQNPNGDRTPGLADGKFEEYRDIRGLGSDNQSGLFLENLRLRLFRPDEAYSIELSGKNW